MESRWCNGVIETAVGAEYIDKVYISTDSTEIERCVDKMSFDKIQVIGRSPKTATDEASSELALIEFCNRHMFHHVFFIQATSPLLESEHLDEAWENYQRRSYDSMVSVVRQNRFIWQLTGENFARPMNYDPVRRPRRQDFTGFLVENGAFYLSKRDLILSSSCRISGKIGVYEMPDYAYYELDEPDDWIVVEQLLLARKNAAHGESLARIKMLVMDCDGVLTDGGMYYSPEGDMLKKFNTKDGKGIELLRNVGIKTAVVTRENTNIVHKRTEKLSIDYVYLGVMDKAIIIEDISHKSGIHPNDMAYVGDDVNDLSAMHLCGFTACPEDAAEKVKRYVDLILPRTGGRGVVRYMADLLMRRINH